MTVTQNSKAFFNSSAETTSSLNSIVDQPNVTGNESDLTSSINYLPTTGQFDKLIGQQNLLNVVVIDEVHKIFDRMPSFRPAFDSLKQLSCPLLAMSATLTNEQIGILKTAHLHKENCLTITQGVHRDNFKLQLKRYKRKKTPVAI